MNTKCAATPFPFGNSVKLKPLSCNDCDGGGGAGGNADRGGGGAGGNADNFLPPLGGTLRSLTLKLEDANLIEVEEGLRSA